MTKPSLESANASLLPDRTALSDRSQIAAMEPPPPPCTKTKKDETKASTPFLYKERPNAKERPNVVGDAAHQTHRHGGALAR